MKNSTKKTARKSTTAKTVKASVASRKRIDSGLFIVKLAQGNPRREGSLGHKSFSVVKNGITVNTFVKKGGRLRDLHWDLDKGNLKLVSNMKKAS